MILFLSKYYNIKLSLIMQLHVCQFNTADVLLLAMNLLKLRGTVNSSFTFQKVTCSFHYYGSYRSSVLGFWGTILGTNYYHFICNDSFSIFSFTPSFHKIYHLSHFQITAKQERMQLN